jgi:hypothetical protein
MRETGVHPCERVKLVGTRAPPVLFFRNTECWTHVAHNIPQTNSQYRCKHLSLDVARTTVRNIEHSLSQHRKSFSQHPPRVAPRSTADRGLHPNRAAQHPARIGRPGASSTGENSVGETQMVFFADLSRTVRSYNARCCKGRTSHATPPSRNLLCRRLPPSAPPSCIHRGHCARLRHRRTSCVVGPHRRCALANEHRARMCRRHARWSKPMCALRHTGLCPPEELACAPAHAPQKELACARLIGRSHRRCSLRWRI